jgi:stage II sporulation SpoAA-like protein
VIELVGGLPKNVVGISVSGRLTVQECRDVLMPAMRKSLKYHDKIRLYYELGSRFPGAAWDDLDLGLEHFSRCERVAIVTDTGWVRHTVKAVRFLIPSEIRVFSTIEAEEGWAWITAPPGADAAVQIAQPVRTRLLRSRRMRRSSAAASASRARRSPPRRRPSPPPAQDQVALP